MAEPSRPARLWYQSFVHPIEQARYIERLQALLDAAAGPGIGFEVHGLDPPDHLFHPLTEFRRAAQTIRNALDAEREGYDAFVIGHFQEPGLLEIRGAVDMDLPGFMRAFTDDASYAEVRADFVEQVRPLVAAGAEIVIPAGGLPMLLFARERPFVIDGALVLNGIAVVAKAAEMALALRRLTGSVVSRRGTYAKASAACVEEYLQARC